MLFTHKSNNSVLWFFSSISPLILLANKIQTLEPFAQKVAPKESSFPPGPPGALQVRPESWVRPQGREEDLPSNLKPSPQGQPEVFLYSSWLKEENLFLLVVLEIQNGRISAKHSSFTSFNQAFFFFQTQQAILSK